MKFIYLIILHFVLILSVNGVHFLGGTITWRPLNTSATGTPVAIVITQTYSWTYAKIPCTQALIANNSYVPSYALLSTQKLECTYSCGISSIGYPNISVIPRCTDFSAPAGTTVGQRLDTVYLEVNDDFAAAYRYSAWRALATNPSAAWSLSVRFIIKPRSDTGLYNNAPVATVMSPVYIPFNQTINITIPVADADGDVTRCRWSSNSNGTDECAAVCPPGSLPPNTLIYPNCTIIITGLNLSDWYAVAVMVEDFINPSSTTPLSSVPVQFLVYVINASSCTTLPKIIGIPAKQSCLPITVGQTFTSKLIAQNSCGPNVTIVDISTLSFAGMITSNITQIDSINYYKTLTWIPTTAQLGYQIMCAMAYDSQFLQSTQYCFKFYISQNELCNCPGEVCSISSTIPAHGLNPIIWPIIGTIIALVLFGALGCCCYLCSYLYPWPVNRRTKGTIELYHIEPCTDPKCQPWSVPVLFNVSSLPNKPNRISILRKIKSENNHESFKHRLTKLRPYDSCPDNLLSTTMQSKYTSRWAIPINCKQIGKIKVKRKKITSRTYIKEEKQKQKKNRFKGTCIEYVSRVK